MEPETPQQIIEAAGGIEAFLNGNPAIRTFPWPIWYGWDLRSLRKQAQFNFMWGRFSTPVNDYPDDHQIEQMDSIAKERSAEFDRLVIRWQRIFDADDKDKFDHLPHDEFCDTAYWVALAEHMKSTADFTCSDCRRVAINRRGLEVHHKTYRNRGREYPDHLDDLVVLCGSCHGRRHGKIR